MHDLHRMSEEQVRRRGRTYVSHRRTTELDLTLRRGAPGVSPSALVIVMALQAVQLLNDAKLETDGNSKVGQSR